MKKGLLRDKIHIAPNYFNIFEYFEQMNKSYDEWFFKKVSDIIKVCGDECWERIGKGEIPIDEETEKKLESTLKGKELEDWRQKEFDCFMAYIQFNDLGVMHKAFFNSFIIYLFAEFEHILNTACMNYKNKFRPRLALQDISGKGIVRAFNYMEKVANITLPEKDIKDQLILIRDIRNVLVHSSGLTSNVNLKTRLKIFPNIEIGEISNSKKYELVIDNKFCEEAMGIIEDFLLQLVKNNNETFTHWSVIT